MNRWSLKPCNRRRFHAVIMLLALLPALAGPAAAATVGQSNNGTPAAVVTRPRIERDRSADVLEPMNSSERQGYACLVGGGTSLGLAAAAGATESILIVTGGSLLPSSPVLLWSALAGTLFASVCGASAVAVPAVLRLWDYYVYGMRPTPGAVPTPEADPSN
jgi:hypothetical protein